MDHNQRIYDADQARAVLDNPAFAQAFADLKAEITESWQNAPVRDKEGREELFKLLKTAEKLEAILRSSLDSGKLAREQIKHEQTLMDRAKAAVGF